MDKIIKEIKINNSVRVTDCPSNEEIINQLDRQLTECKLYIKQLERGGATLQQQVDELNEQLDSQAEELIDSFKSMESIRNEKLASEKQILVNGLEKIADLIEMILHCNSHKECNAYKRKKRRLGYVR